MRTRSSAAAEKHYRSMIRLYELYDEQLREHAEEISEHHRKRLVNKRGHAAENALFDSLGAEAGEFKSRLRELKSLKMYPYPFRRENLCLKRYPSKKAKLIALMKYPLPIEIYAWLAAFAVRRTGKRL